MPITQQQNPAVDFADIFSKVAPFFVGTPGSNTNSTTTSSLDPASQAIMQAILSSIGSGDYSKTAAIADSTGPVANLVQQALQTQLPGITSKGKASGLYNSTTQAMLTNDLAARTSAAGADVVQNNIKNYAAINQANLDAATRAASLTASKTTSTKATPPIDLGSLLLKTGVGLVAQKYGKKAFDVISDKFPGGTTATENSITATQSADDATSLIPDTQGLDTGTAAGTGVEQGFTAADSLAADTGGVSEFVGGAGADLAEGFTSAEIGGADGLAGLGGSIGADAAIGAGADAFAGAAAEGIAGDVGGAVFAGAAADAGADIGIGEIATAALSAVICTESVRQGLMDPALYKNEARIMKEKLSATSIRGYHHIAPYWVLRMREDKKIAKRLASWACAYADFIVNGKRSVTSTLLHYLGRPVCFIVGTVLQEEPDISHLRVGV